MNLDRILSTRHLGLKLAGALVLDFIALTVLRSHWLIDWCDKLDGAIADIGDDE